MLIGLTGGIASGKTTVSNLLADLGAVIIDADQIAHQVLIRGNPGWQAVVDYFGQDILTKDGDIDRSKLGQIVFTNQAEKEKLEEITHPLIIDRIIKQINHLKGDQEVIVLDAPLLYETGLDRLVDQTWVVYVEQKTQIKRLQNRDRFTKKEALSRVKSQLALEKKVQLADVVINNNTSKEDLHKLILKLWRGLTMPRTRIALIAHDEKKPEIIQFARDNYDLLHECLLVATGTTGQLLIDEVGLTVQRMNSGPLGGDQMIGAEIAKEKIDGVIFLRDPLTAQPHEPDITALLRVCDVHNVPLATNLATADLILHGIINNSSSR